MRAAPALLAGLAMALLAPSGVAAQADSPAVVRSEFVYETAPFPSAHASTVAETDDGLLAAWFGGEGEGEDDVGIWTSRRGAAGWTTPVEVATGVQPDGTRHPCWNPVLFEVEPGTVTLFYKVGPSPRGWWGMSMTSRDGGRTWDTPVRLPNGVLGPVKNKPVRLADGTLLSPSSTETATRPSTWRVHFERSVDGGRSWSLVRPPLRTGAEPIEAIQPSVLVHADGRLQAVGRSRSGRVFETWSSDGGRSWTELSLTSLPNPSAGTDALTLADGRHLLVYNHTERGRRRLNVAISEDGRAWSAALELENAEGEYSYPAVIQSADGLVHVTYTWRRLRIKHVVLDPSRLDPVPMSGGAWPDGRR